MAKLTLQHKQCAAIGAILLSLVTLLIFVPNRNLVFSFRDSYKKQNYITNATNITCESDLNNITNTSNETSNVQISEIQPCNFYETNSSNYYLSKQNIENNDSIDLSIIIASRNDNYGNNPLFRFALVLRQFLHFPWYSKYDLLIEIMIIEWNVVETNQHIFEEDIIQNIIKKISNTKIQLKFISIPHKYCLDIHDTSKYCPFYEYRAKNVGLRNSNGKWKLVTNIDDLFSIRLLNHIANGISNNTLNKNTIYQTPKKGINIAIYTKNGKELLLNDMELLNKININNITQNIFKIDGNKLIEYDNNNNNLIKIPNMDENGKNERLCCLSNNKGLKHSAGDFNLFYYKVLNKYGGGYLETESNTHFDTEFIIRQIFINGYNSKQFNKDCSYVHINHDYDRRQGNKKNNIYIKWDLNMINNKNNKYKLLHNYTSFDCEKAKQSVVRDFVIGIEKFKKIPNQKVFNIDNFWNQYVLPTTNKSWGLKGIHLNQYICNL